MKQREGEGSDPASRSSISPEDLVSFCNDLIKSP